MSDIFKQQSEELASGVADFSANYGEAAAERFQNGSILILSWIDYLERELSHHVCDDLLAACRAAQIEAAACLSLGLVRPALFAIRLQFELLLAWLYFNDHSIEWGCTERAELDFPMRKQNLSYLERHSARFKTRFILLQSRAGRSDREPYRTLSSFVHGSTRETMPQTDSLKSVVQSPEALEACQKLQSDVSEYLSDVVAAWLADRWMDFPAAIKVNIGGRLSQSQLRDFCTT